MAYAQGLDIYQVAELQNNPMSSHRRLGKKLDTSAAFVRGSKFSSVAALSSVAGPDAQVGDKGAKERASLLLARQVANR